ncbi:MAG: cyclodeaminase/cyclohydrolase family protein [Clostridia bacterium]|nr:cyclodeaminase/cyclohydrolase family protein [Clostridia bacterium]
MDFKDMKVSEFLEALASSTPAPGGGSASAVAAAMGLALVSMVAGLTSTEGMEAEDAAKVASAGARSKELMQAVLKCADDDTAAFNQVMAAYRMRRSTDDEKRARRDAIQAALKGAVAAPEHTAELAVEGMRYAAFLAERGNENAVSDAGVAALLLDTAVGGAVFNMKINLAAIRDASFVADAQATAARYSTDKEESRHRAVRAVAGKIGGD